MVKPVMITGAGIVSAIGCGKAETLDSLLHQRTGIGKLRYLQTEHREYPVGEVKLSDEEMKQLLGIDSEPTTRSILLGMLAVREALEEAGLPLSPAKGRGDDIAFISGTTVGGMDKSERYYLDFLANDARLWGYDEYDSRQVRHLLAGDQYLDSLFFGCQCYHLWRQPHS